MQSRFPGGVIWLECGPNPIESVQERLASHLGLRLEGNDPATRADRLAYALAAHPAALTVLDDIRGKHLHRIHLLHPPGVPGSLLVTSRRRNVLPDSAVYTVRTLSPEAGAALLRREVGKAVADAETPLLSEIVAAVEAIPLALILAGAYARKSLERRSPPEQPLAYLLAELTRRRAEVLHRDNSPHLSMRVAFDLSYDELDEADQQRIARLGVFASNEFGLDALAHVWETDEESCRQSTARLENSGLIEEIDDGRWWMHDVLRDFAGEHLNDDARAAARRGHARWVECFLAGLELLSLDDWQGLAAERAEIDRAGEWLLDSWERDPALAARLAWALGQKLRNDYNDGRIAWLRVGVQAADAADAPRAKGVVLMDLANLLRNRGEYDEAERLYRESLRVKESLEDSRSVAVTQSSLADLLRNRGEYDEAERLYWESLAVKESLGDSREVAVTQSSLADLLQNRGEYDEAERLLESALNICRDIRELQGVAVCQMKLGVLKAMRGNREEGIALLHEARQGLLAIGLGNWAAQVDEILGQMPPS